MGKENKGKPNSSAPEANDTLEKRENAIQEKKKELDQLSREVGNLNKNGEEIDALVKSIELLIFELTDNRGKARRYIKDQGRFEKEIKKISNKIEEKRSTLRELSTEKPKVEAAKSKVEEAEKEAEAPKPDNAPAEDLEYREFFQEKYNDAVGNYDDFIVHIKNLNLEKEYSKDVSGLKEMLKEMKVWEERKNREEFESTRKKFDEYLENFYHQEEKKSVPETKPAVSAPDKQKEQKVPVTPDTDKVRFKNSTQQEREKYHEESQSKYNRLVKALKAADKATAHKEKLEELREYLQEAKKTNDVKVFSQNINNFRREIIALEAVVAAPEAVVKKESAPEEKKVTPPKPAEPEKIEKPKSHQEPEKSYTDNLQKLRNLKAAVEKADKDQKRQNNLQGVYKKEFRIVGAKTEPETVAAEITPAPAKPVSPTEQPAIVPPSEPAQPSADIEVEKDIEEQQPTAAQEAPKKSLWARAKEKTKKITDAIFNRDTGKALGKMSYDTVTSVLGLKLVTDIARAAWSGEGDFAEWRKGSKEAESSRDAIFEAYQSLLESFVKEKKNKVLEENEAIEKRIDDFDDKINSANISPEVKKALRDRLEAIAEKYKEDFAKNKKVRDEEVKRVLDAYVQGKISGMKIAKDALNFALTASAMPMLRGLVYAGASIAERAGKAKREFVKETASAENKKSERKFIAKDVLVNSAIETARALTWQGAKKGASGKTKAVDFIKALGTVARGFGIYGLAVSGVESPLQSIGKFFHQLKERGVAGAISDNFIKNAEHTAQMYAHPIETLEKKFQGHEKLATTIPTAPEHHDFVSAAPATHEVPAPAPLPDSPADQFTLNDKQGILHAANYFEKHDAQLFTHDDGSAWTKQEIHNWRVQELKGMGFKIKGDYWGYPVTVHGGAKVELITDAQGKPHLHLVDDEHVTHHKNYKWVDTEPGKHAAEKTVPTEPPHNTPAEHAAAAHEHDYQAQTAKPAADFPPTEPVVVPAHQAIEKTAAVVHTTEVAPQNTAPAPVAVKNSLNSKESIVAPAVKVGAGSEVEYKAEPVSQFLKEHNSSPAEFVATYYKMVDSVTDHLNNSFLFRGNAAEILQKKIQHMVDVGEQYENDIKSGARMDRKTLEAADKILQAEDRFKFHQPDWEKTLGQTMFDEKDKAINLAMAPDRDVLINPILTNGGHAARIWDPVEGKDVFIYDKDRMFNTNNEGRLVVEDERGITKVLNQKQALKMAEEIPE